MKIRCIELEPLLLLLINVHIKQGEAFLKNLICRLVINLSR